MTAIQNSSLLDHVQASKSKLLDASQLLGEKLSDMNQTVSNTADDLKEEVVKSWDEVKANIKNYDMKQLNSRLVGTISEHPWTSLGVTFMAGALVGYRLLKR